MPFTTPRTWVTGEVVTAGLLNTHVRDNISFLANPPKCRVYNNANISISDNTETSLTFNSERFDTDTMHDTGTNPGRITIKTAGTYLVGANFRLQVGNDYTLIYLLLRLNGTAPIATHSIGSWTDSTIPPLLSVTTLYAFAVNDYVEMRVYNQNTANTARNVLTNGNDSPEFFAIWHSL